MNNKMKQEIYQSYKAIIIQLTESLACDVADIEDEVNILNMTEYWVENIMLSVCEDNNVMKKCLKKSFDDFISKYK